MNSFKSGDIFLADKGFCSYFDVSKLRDQGVDSVITLTRRTPVSEADAVEVLGQQDVLIRWKKPQRNKTSSYSEADREVLPETLLLRQIEATIRQSGFRSKGFYIVTTLLDSTTYTADDLAHLYFQRWDVELYFRDIKTTMGLDILRCKSPDMVRKEIVMHLIAYNGIRYLMTEAATRSVSRHVESVLKAVFRRFVSGSRISIRRRSANKNRSGCSNCYTTRSRIVRCQSDREEASPERSNEDLNRFNP